MIVFMNYRKNGVHFKKLYAPITPVLGLINFKPLWITSSRLSIKCEIRVCNIDDISSVCATLFALNYVGFSFHLYQQLNEAIKNLKFINGDITDPIHPPLPLQTP